MLRAIHDTFIEERPVPKLRDEWDVRVRIEQTGICGSDVHYWDHGRISGEAPNVLVNQTIIESRR